MVYPLVESGSLRLAEFRCSPSHPSWSAENFIGPLPHLVFPGTPVGITRGDIGRQVQDRNWVVFYPRGQPYRRDVVHPAGDVCSYVEMSPELLDDIFSRRQHAARILQTGRARLSPHAWMAYQLVLTRARRGEMSDPSVVENLIADILDAADVTPDPALVDRDPSTSRRPVRDTVNAACQLGGLRLSERLQLDDVAEAVNVSPFHLARLFRATTGTTLHSYREQLRLRTACALLAEPDARLTDIAQRTGFFSHSHLTTRFSRSFGMSPSTAREMMQAQITQ